MSHTSSTRRSRRTLSDLELMLILATVATVTVGGMVWFFTSIGWL